MSVILGIGGLLLTVVGFILGRIFSQSEAVLVEKRRVYEDFLMACPMPNAAYSECGEGSVDIRFDDYHAEFPKLLLYGSPAVILAANLYSTEFMKADEVLDHNCEPLHPAFKPLAKRHNDLILEMRRDALGWSMFGYHGKSRLPSDALEKAQKNAL